MLQPSRDLWLLVQMYSWSGHFSLTTRHLAQDGLPPFHKHQRVKAFSYWPVDNVPWTDQSGHVLKGWFLSPNQQALPVNDRLTW